MTHKDKRYLCIITLISILLISFLTSTSLFGNKIDWYSQHVVIGDALRHAIRQEGTLLPTYMKQIMGGGNIYHFSYYGYLRPDILIGALFINVKMQTIIILYSIAMMILTVICCYLFLRKQCENENICLFVSMLIMLSTIIYHSHKQIMFVNYLPFLFLALISIEDRHYTTFTIWGSLIVLHSYYYSIGCFMICLIYMLYRHKEDYKKLFFSYSVIVMLTAILTIPTLLVILSNGKSCAGTSFYKLFIPSLSLKGLLYNKYGCGLTYFSYIMLVLALSDQKLKNLSLTCLISFFCPIIWLIMNGFLYARSKILIVFLPLVAYIICQMMIKLTKERIKINKPTLILMIIPLFFVKHPQYAFIDFLICMLLLLERKKKYIIAYLVIPLIVVSSINKPSSFFVLNKYQKDIDQIVNRNTIHTLSDTVTRQNVNKTYSNVQRMSGYTSTDNKYYNTFLFDTLRIPIPTNNRVAINDTNNIFYLRMLNIDSLLTKGDGPEGYVLKDKKKKVKLYQSEQELPVAYATSNLISEKDFDSLKYPYTLDTLMHNAVVAQGNTKYQSQFKQEYKDDHSYTIKKAQKKVIDLDIKNKIAILEFDIKNNKPDHAVSITINGTKNKLPRITNPYYHPHTHFTYVLSNTKKLHIKVSGGNYTIKNISLYTIPYSSLNRKVDGLKSIESQDVLKGTINVHKDGYFITRIPYESGYKIYIDNKQTSIERVNKAFIGCRITKGKHTIRITFRPPGYYYACMISFIGFLFLLWLFIYERRF